MEIVDGYQLLEQLLLLVPYIQIVQLLQEQLLQYAKLGDQLVFLMEQLVLPNQPVLSIQLNRLVETKELMVHAFG